MNKNYIVNTRQIIVGNDVWIGRGCTILSGVQIGNGSVLAANTIITKDVPPYAIVIGNPPRILKYRFDAETIRKLQAIKWWNWSIGDIMYRFAEVNEDPYKLVEKYYTPELEKYPRTKSGDHIRDLKYQGRKIYSTIADFDSDSPLWQKILIDFAKYADTNSILVFHLPKNVDPQKINLLRSNLYQTGGNQNVIAVISQDDKPFEIDSLRETDILLTTQEIDTLLAIDYLHDKHFETRYIFDDKVFY